MKKIKASLIKRILRISSQLLLVISFCQFYLGSLSLSYILSHSLGHKVFFENSWWSVVYLGFGSRRQRKSRKAKEDSGINNYNGFCLQVPSCMYDFLASFGMHGTCMSFLGCDMSLAWRISWIDNGFSQPFDFLDIHGVVGLPLLF